MDVETALAVLVDAGVRLDRGLSPAELGEVENRFAVRFSVEHRTLLTAALPVGDRWPDWRSGSSRALRSAVDAPVDGVVFDVVNNGFWRPEWGVRPAGPRCIDLARSWLATVPKLVPVYAHRYLSCLPDGPVLSVHQTDVLVYGRNLLDYLEHEFGKRPPRSGHDTSANGVKRIEFWSELVRANSSPRSR